MSMEASNQDFNATVIAAVDNKIMALNASDLPRVQDAYRLHLTCVNNLIDALTRRSLIIPDPYQKEKKISSIVPPDDSPFNDTERATQLGVRICDYQSMLDYVCNYMKFSVEQLNVERIRKLMALNNSFAWNNLSPNSPKANTRALALCLSEARSGAQPLQIAMLSDSLRKAKESLESITNGLKELEAFQKERYKADVRRTILCGKDFNREALAAAGPLLAEIKRLFPTAMPKRPFANELIAELVEEETSPNKLQLQDQLLAKLQMSSSRKEKKQEEVDTHAMLMEAVRTTGLLHEQYDVIIEKISHNNEVLESSHNTFKDKAARFFRKVFGLPEPEVEYNITITDKATDQKRKENVNFNGFVTNLSKRSKYYAGIAVKNTPGYNRVNAQKDDAILEFLEKQLADNGRLQIILAALDDFFKDSATPAVRPKIKGIKMELTTLKNVWVKANQEKAEYVAYLEEKEQMKKLGITDA